MQSWYCREHGQSLPERCGHQSKSKPPGRLLNFTLYTLHFTLYILHFTLYTLHFTLHTLHFTFYTLHIKKLCTCSTEYHTITLYMGTIVLDTNNPDCLIFISTVGTFKLRINACLISSFQLSHLSINLACLSVCLSVCLYPINVKTAEPIGPKFFVGHLGIPGKVYEWSKFQIFVSIKIRSSLNFRKFWKSAKFFVKIRELFLFCFTMYTKRTCSQLI